MTKLANYLTTTSIMSADLRSCVTMLYGTIPLPGSSVEFVVGISDICTRAVLDELRFCARANKRKPPTDLLMQNCPTDAISNILANNPPI